MSSKTAAERRPRRRLIPVSVGWLAEDMPVSIPPEDLTEYQYEMDLLEHWTPDPTSTKLDISN